MWSMRKQKFALDALCAVCRNAVNRVYVNYILCATQKNAIVNVECFESALLDRI